MAHIVSDTIDLGNPGTAVQLSSLKNRCLAIRVKGLVTNAAEVYIGPSTVDASTSPPTGYPIEAGEWEDLNPSLVVGGEAHSIPLNEIFADALTANDDISFIALVE